MQAWLLCPRGLRQPYPTSRMWRHVQVATSSMGGALKHAHVEERASGDFGHGRSPQGSRLRQHLGGARKPHAVVLMTFKSCSSACVATLSTCSSEVTSNLAQAHVRASCSAARSLEPPALAQLSAQTLIGEPSPVVAAHTWPLCPRAAELLGGARKHHAAVLLPFVTCIRACVATLCTCSSEFTSVLAQAHSSLSCPPARALEPTALAKASSQPLIG